LLPTNTAPILFIISLLLFSANSPINIITTMPFFCILW
jgi:hypothetical protein